MNISKSNKVELVVVGAFEPNRITPRVLYEAAVITAAEFDVCEVVALLPDQVSSYRFGAMQYQVIPSRLSVSIEAAPFVRAADFVTKVLVDVCPPQYVAAVGINLVAELDVGSTSRRDRIGSKLAPPQMWGPWGHEIAEDMARPMEEKRHGGLMSMRIRQVNPSDRKFGWVEARIEPSASIPNDVGICLQINDHFQAVELGEPLPKARDLSSIDWLLKILSEEFDGSIVRALSIVDSVSSLSE